MSKSWKEALQMAALGVGVTLIGLVVGAFVMSPVVSREQRMLAFAALGGTALLVLLFDAIRRGMGALSKRRGRRASLSGSRVSAANRPPGAAPPTITLRPGKAGRTPRAVQALAAAGASATEIAWKTGLPLDAVCMLLQIHGAPLASR